LERFVKEDGRRKNLGEERGRTIGTGKREEGPEVRRKRPGTRWEETKVRHWQRRLRWGEGEGSVGTLIQRPIAQIRGGNGNPETKKTIKWGGIRRVNTVHLTTTRRSKGSYGNGTDCQPSVVSSTGRKGRKTARGSDLWGKNKDALLFEKVGLQKKTSSWCANRKIRRDLKRQRKQG